jgi:two-component sensor histidine kinase
MMKAETELELLAENQTLRERLDEAEETLRALRNGEVDAVVTGGPAGDQVYTLRGADAVYRLMVQEMAEGAVTVLPDGLILFSNEQCASTLGIPLGSLVGSSIHDFVVQEDAPIVEGLLRGLSTLAPNVRLQKFGATPMHVPVRVSANTLILDEVAYICLIVTDLSEQERRNHELAAVVSQKTELLRTMELHAERLRQSVAEKQLLLKEVHHRVKNNLQVISSLLRMQSRHASDSVSRALEETQRRILSMALISETLYGSEEMREIDFGQYAHSLVADIFQTYALPNITRNITADVVMLNIDQAVPCGLILNELVMNGLKYAYPENGRGELTLNISRTAADEVSIVVSDQGIGLGDGVDLREPKSLGLSIVTILAKQLGGQLSVRRQPGATFDVTFPRKTVRMSALEPVGA